MYEYTLPLPLNVNSVRASPPHSGQTSRGGKIFDSQCGQANYNEIIKKEQEDIKWEMQEEDESKKEELKVVCPTAVIQHSSRNGTQDEIGRASCRERV